MFVLLSVQMLAYVRGTLRHVNLTDEAVKVAVRIHKQVAVGFKVRGIDGRGGGGRLREDDWAVICKILEAEFVSVHEEGSGEGEEN